MIYAGPIFKDRGRLSPHYIPKELPHREEQIRILLNTFSDIIERPWGSPFRLVQIIGPVGSGKTCTCIRFADILEQEAKKKGNTILPVYVNLKLHGGSRVLLYRYIVQRAAPEVYSTSLGAEELLLQLMERMRQTKKYILLILDEIDYFLKHSKETRVIYELTRLDEFLRPGESTSFVGVVLTARSKEFYRELDEAELSSLGRVPMEFQPYSAGQVVSILSKRVEEAFREGAVSAEIIDYIADITVSPSVGGDIRYALDILLYAGELAENEGKPRVEVEHVRKIVGETLPSITSEDVEALSDEHKLALMAVARGLRKAKAPYIPLKEIRSMLSLLVEERGLRPPSDMEETLEDLEHRGILEIKSLTQIGIRGASTQALDRLLDQLLPKFDRGRR